MNKAILVWVVLSLIWGSTWIFIKLGLRDLPPVTFAGLRFLVACLVLWGVVLVRRVVMPREARIWLLLAGTGIVSISLNYGLIFWGEMRITSGLAAVLQSTIPVFGIVIAHHYLPTERISLRKLAGIGLGFVGVSLIFYDQMWIDGRTGFEGSVALIFSSICVAWGNVLVKSKLPHLDPALLAAGQMLFGFPPLLLLGWWWEGSPFELHWSTLSLVSLGYLALVGSALAFLLYYWLVARIEVTKTMLISLVTPVVALIIGALAIGERITWSILVGSLTILAGISTIVYTARPRKAGGGPEQEQKR